MATTKKKVEDELDYTNQPQAMTAEDVNNQDARTRLWQSLDYSYGNQIKKSNESYAQAYSQADRQALSRGMGRSSYNNQTLANINLKKAEAENDIRAAQIADYQSRIGQIEQQEKEDERWERQYADSRADAEWNKAFQQNQFDYTKSQDALAQQNYLKEFEYKQGRDAIADQQWQKQYDESLRQFNEQMAYQKERAKVSDAQWQKTYEENLRQFNEQMAKQEAQFKYQQEQDAYNRAFQEQQYADSRSDAAWQKAFTEQQYADSRADTAWNQAFQERQWQAQLDQWNKTFDYNAMSDEQKINYNYVTYALQQGADVSDEMLRKAGLSRSDYNAMKQQAAANGATGGGGYNPGNTTGDTTGTETPKTVNDFISDLYAGIDEASRGKANDFSGLKPGVDLTNITAPGERGEKAINGFNNTSGLNVNTAQAVASGQNKGSDARALGEQKQKIQNEIDYIKSQMAKTTNASARSAMQQQINSLTSRLNSLK